MRDFHVFIEQQGEQIYVGKITGSGSELVKMKMCYLQHIGMIELLTKNVGLWMG